MSIIEAVKKLGRPPIPTGPDLAPAVQEKIAAAEAQLFVLHAELPSASLDATLEVEGAEDRLLDLEARIATAEKSLVTLRSALQEAEATDKRKWAKQRAAIHRSQFLAVKKTLAQRQEAAGRLAVHIENAVHEFNEIVRLSETAARKSQVIRETSAVYQPGELLSAHEVYLATALELRRQGSHWPVTPENARLRAFPTDAPHRNVGEIRPLVELVRSADERILSTLEGREPAKFDRAT
jgi:hypothetical protein